MIDVSFHIRGMGTDVDVRFRNNEAYKYAVIKIQTDEGDFSLFGSFDQIKAIIEKLNADLQ